MRGKSTARIGNEKHVILFDPSGPQELARNSERREGPESSGDGDSNEIPVPHDEEKEKLISDLRFANNHIASKDMEKAERAAELAIAIKELVFQNEEKEKRAAELVIATQFAELDRLQGLIPICSCCKKIRQEHGLWQQMESYIMEPSRALFSHTICPECTEREFGEFLRAERPDMPK